MNRINVAVIVLALAVKICWGGIIVKHAELNESAQIIDVVVNVLECYYKNSGKAAGLVGHMPDSFHQKVAEKIIPVTLLDDYRTKAYKSRFHRWELYKLNVFVLTAASSKRFYETIRMTEYSKWWDLTAHHLIVDWSSADNDGCIDSAKNLFKAWENNMINARVICQNRTGGVKFYGYNPYTAEAREPWKLEKIYSRNNSHPFAVFSQDYRNSDRICETVGADGIKNLAGYPFCYEEDYELQVSDQSKWRSAMVFGMTTTNVFRIINLSLNMTPVFRTSSTDKRFETIDECMWALPFDVSLALYDNDFGYKTYSYPIDKIDLLAVTQFRGHKTQLQKILTVTDVPSRIGLCLVLLLTLLFFKFFVHHSGMASFLNVLRIVCNTGFANMPDNLSTKLYIGTVLLFAVVMQGVYQGNLAALLTQTVPIRDAMTKQDLVDMDYTVFVQPDHVPLCFTDPMFDGHITTRIVTNLSRLLNERPLTAYVHDADYIKDKAWQFKFHVVGEPMGSYYQSYIFPVKTHLEERINMILLKIREADIAVPMRARGLDRTVSQFEFDEEVQKNQDWKVITLGDLEFAFVILGIGLSCAAITFIIELIIARRPRTITTRVQFLS